LRTSIDTLALHWREMTDEDRSEVLAVSQTETAYFMELMESLLFMAQMDEPRYKKSTQQVSLLRLVEEELRIRQATELARSSEVRWELDQRDPKVKAMIAGDPHLLRRLIKNALENAARFASSRVKLRLWEQVDTVVLQIEDDGPGMTPEEISQFGKTRSRRLVNPRGASHVSLGLGSVIMIKILAIHQGTLEIKSAGGISQGGSATGTQLEIRLPRSLSDEETE
jgi:K+-sensing histidine kinase KdpD